MIEDGKYTWDTDSSCTTNTSSCNSSTKGTCRDGKRCVIEDGKYTWDRDETCTTDSGAYKCSSPVGNINTCNNGKRCLTVNGDPKWVPDTTCGGGTTGDKCLDGTGVGKCNTSGQYCSEAGKSPSMNIDKCYCDDGEFSRKPEQCVETKSKLCKLNSSGLADVSTTPCSGATTEQCTITPYYTYRVGDNMCLSTTSSNACALTCNGSTKALTRAECRRLDIKDCLVGVGSGPAPLNITEIDLEGLSSGELKLLIEKEPQVKALVQKKLGELISKLDSWTCGKDGWSSRNTAKRFCNVLDGKWDWELKEQCLNDTPKYQADYSCIPVVSLNNSWEITKRTYAQDDPSDGYTLYLPEYGMYSFELGDYELTKSTTGGETYYIFYIEANDEKGFQMPKDFDNPTPDEDIMLKSNSAAITYKKVSSAQSYTLVKGINLVSFNFIPVSTDLGPLTAKGVIEEAAKKDVTIQYISSFDGGRWAKGYTCKDNKCSGNDFNIIPGKGYLVYVTEGGDISIGGYTLKSSVPVNLSGGWNLVGIHGYTNAYTARTLIDSMNKIDGITANNVTWWPTSKGMYEGLQVTEEQQYGFDFPISPTNGYFVRISSFQPEDSKCKSLLWNEGGTLNGACGVTK
ncbi:MAG TPA: hypothetical protein PLE98_00965 [Candidatus Dojkabacteria bacterium]|nr:hypothetical protein [Candidatus Dojkabacteria bacterium]